MVNPSYINYVSKEALLFIVDLENHTFNGLELIKMIRKSAKTVPMLAMSKNADIKRLANIVKEGCNDFILKPFADETLVYKAKALVGIKGNQEHSPNQFVPAKHTTDSEYTLYWKNDFLIGIEAIDNEHKALFDKYSELYALMKSGKGHTYYNELLSFLNEYVTTHFQHEQSIHLDSNYPAKDEHILIHEEFKASIANIFEKVRPMKLKILS